MIYKYQQNQRVKVDITGVVQTTGRVVGVAHTGAPIIGPSYIIDPDFSIFSETYPYSHFVCFEVHLSPLPE